MKASYRIAPRFSSRLAATSRQKCEVDLLKPWPWHAVLNFYVVASKLKASRALAVTLKPGR
eukprot:6197657-Pleurochrysis_carterae.AAC.10